MQVLQSGTLCDRNLEPINVVDALAGAGSKIAQAITPNVAGGSDAAGGHVTSLTEAVMGITKGLIEIAHALSDVAEAIRSSTPDHN